MSQQQEAEKDPLVAERVAARLADSAAYALACRVADGDTGYWPGDRVPSIEELTEKFRQARATWIEADRLRREHERTLSPAAQSR